MATSCWIQTDDRWTGGKEAYLTSPRLWRIARNAAHVWIARKTSQLRSAALWTSWAKKARIPWAFDDDFGDAVPQCAFRVRQLPATDEDCSLARHRSPSLAPD